ncbi:MAG TPA: hypothetical protein VH207_00110 [Chthoniobacterales bacterium]|nr:hypothetical protein [Chthoniobacterales bacterium]
MESRGRGTYNDGMGRRLIKGAIVLVSLGALLVAYIAGARSLSLALDRIHTVPMESRPISEICLEDADRGMLRIDDLRLSLAGTDYRPYPMTTKIDPGRQFVIETAGHAIALGPVEKSSGVLRPEPGDKARFRIEHSMLSWPTPLEINFLSGQSPSWKRHVYYRLSWEKPDGGRLEMVWRYEQWFYEKWASGFMTRAGSTGLIRVDIRP